MLKLRGWIQNIAKWGDARTAVALFLILWATYASIGPGDTTANPNVVTRMGVVYAIFDDRSVIIDSFAPLTVDKAEFAGHYYLDKAPGLSLMALAPVGVYLAVLRALHIATAPIVAGKFTTSYFASVWLACWTTSAPFTALAAAALYLLARHWRASRMAALFGALVYGLATPAAGWATTFFGHATASGCLFIAFALIAMVSETQGSARRDLVAGLAIAALLVWSVIVEFTTAPAALVVGVFGLYRLALLPARRIKTSAVGAAIGGALAVLPGAVYNVVAFGAVLHAGYQNVVGFDGMSHGFFGISLPDAHVLWEIIFGPYRGILWLCPLFILAPFAYWAAFRRLSFDIAMVMILVPVIYFMINSGYYYWDGGNSMGPRHVTPALAFICLAFVPLWEAAGLAVRAALATLAGLGAVLSLLCASVSMTAPETFAMPLFQYILPRFLDGRVHNVLSYALPGLRSLVVLPLVWIGALWLSASLPGLRAAQPSLASSSRA